MKLVNRIVLFFISAFPLIASAQPTKWTEVAPGVWKGVVGRPEAYDLLKASGASPNVSALGKMKKTIFPFSQADIHNEVSDGKTFLRFPLQREEQLYGFGLNFQTVHQRGKILQLHVDHYGGKDTVFLSMPHVTSKYMLVQVCAGTAKIHHPKKTAILIKPGARVLIPMRWRSWCLQQE